MWVYEKRLEYPVKIKNRIPLSQKLLSLNTVDQIAI